MTDEKPFANIEGHQFPEHWSVIVHGCGLGLDYYEKRVAENVAHQLNAAASLYAREKVKEAMERCVKVAEDVFQDDLDPISIGIGAKAGDMIAAEIRRIMREEGT